jgi:hypothetical protein
MTNLTRAQEAVARFVRANCDKAAQGATDLGSDGLPPAVRDAVQHYYGVAEKSDYRTGFYRFLSEAGELFVIMMIPDGNDGLFEAYTADGGLVGTGQFVMDKVAWADVAEVRALPPGGFLPALQPPLVWEVQPDGNYRSACGRFHINRSGEQWVLDEVPEPGHTLQSAQALAQTVSPFFSVERH